MSAPLSDLLTLKSYSSRAKALHKHGKERGQALAGDAEYKAMKKGTSAFSALSALTVAKGAGVESAWAVDHPSALVRHVVVKDKMLTSDEAERLLVSPDTSREMRARLISSGLAPVNEQTLAAAEALDKEVRGMDTAEWTLLTRGAPNTPLFVERVRGMAKRPKFSALKVTEQTGRKHAAAILQVLGQCREREERLPFRWDEAWVKVIAVEDPRTLLHLLLVYRSPEQLQQQEQRVQQQMQQKAPKTDPWLDARETQVWGGPQSAPRSSLLSELVRWASRHHFALLLEVLTSRSILNISRDAILQIIQASPRTTWKEKLSAVVGTFLAFDRRGDGGFLAQERLMKFVKLLPPCSDPRRSSDHAALLDAFWSMVREANPPEPWQAFAILYQARGATFKDGMKTLPSAVVAAEFLKHHMAVRSHAMAPPGGSRGAAAVDGIGADGYDERWLNREREVYFDLLKKSHLNDEERGKVFEAFLLRDEDELGLCTGAAAHRLFSTLNELATEPEPLQSAYNALLRAFGGKSAMAVLSMVVAKMGKLEKAKESKPEGKGLKYSIVGLPTEWVLLVEPPKQKDVEQMHPCDAYMMATLQSMRREPPSSVLEPLCAQFGRQMFWRTFEKVLAPLLGKRDLVDAGAAKPPAMPLASVLDKLTMVTRESQQQAGATGGGGEGGGGEGNAASSEAEAAAAAARVPSLYLKSCEEYKKQAMVKDAAARQGAYLALITLADSERLEAKSATYDDLMPFLRPKLEKEQDNVKVACIEALVKLGHPFPVEVWMAHVSDLLLLWKACANSRMQSDFWKRHFHPIARTMVCKALEDWHTKAADPAVLDFASMAVHEALIQQSAQQHGGHHTATAAPIEVTKAFIHPLMAAYDKRRRELHATRARLSGSGGADVEMRPAAAAAAAEEEGEEGGEVIPQAAVEWALSQAMLEAPSSSSTTTTTAAKVDGRSRGGGSSPYTLAPLARLFLIADVMGGSFESYDKEDVREVGGLALAWRAFKGLATRWHALLRQTGTLEPSTVEFLLAGVLESLTSYNVRQEARHLRKSVEKLDEGKPMPPPYEPWWAPLTEVGAPAAGATSAYEAAVTACLTAMASGDMRSQLGPAAMRVLGARAKAIEGAADVPAPSGFAGGERQWRERWLPRGQGRSNPWGFQGGYGHLSGARKAPHGYVTPDLTYNQVRAGALDATIAAATAVIAKADSAHVRPLLIGALRIADESPNNNRRAYDSLAQAALPHLSPLVEGRLDVLQMMRGEEELLDDVSGGGGSRGGGSVSLGGGESDRAWLDARGGGKRLLDGLLDRFLEQPGAERDARVQSLCSERVDAPLLLFFGARFHRHLLRSRQDLLHAALTTLVPPPPPSSSPDDEGGGGMAVEPPPVEFYHYYDGPAAGDRRGRSSETGRPTLCQLIAALRVEPQSGAMAEHRKAFLTTWLLHEETQALVLRRGLHHSTDQSVLRILPRLEFADVTPTVNGILQALPKDQTMSSPAPCVAADATSLGRPPAGGDPRLLDVVNAKFAALCADSPPCCPDAVQQKQADDLLSAVGHADNAEMAMHVLSQHASDSRVAREAISTTLPKLSRARARQVLVGLIVGRDTRIGARVAMLRLALELQLPDALGTCVAAYRSGVCHRDVHATILSRLATTPGLLDGADARTLSEQVKPIFTSVAARPSEDATYVVQMVLDEINGKEWQPLFLVETIGHSWAFVPSAASKAIAALQQASGPGVHAADLARSLVSVFTAARMLGIESNAQLLRTHWSNEMHSAWRAPAPTSASWNGILGQWYNTANNYRMDTEVRDATVPSISRKPGPAALRRRADFSSCEPAAVRELVAEILRWGGRGSAPQPQSAKANRAALVGCALQVWVTLLRGSASSDAAEVDWMASQLKAFSSAHAAEDAAAEEADLLCRMAAAAVYRALEARAAMGTKSSSSGGGGDGAVEDVPPICVDGALRAVAQALDANHPASVSGVALIEGCQATLLSLPESESRTAELSALMELTSKVVEESSGGADAARLADGAPRGKTRGLIQRVATSLFPGPHCWAALRWLSESSECTAPPRFGLQVLAELASRAALSGSLTDALTLFDKHQSSPECGRLVERIAASPHGERLLPTALQWLTPLFPHKAAAIYPTLLAQHPTAHMEALLTLCATYSVPLPPLTPEMVKKASSLLLKSALPEARVQAAHALAASVVLNEKDETARAPEGVSKTMHELLRDPCRAVAAVAQHSLLAWGELPKEAPKAGSFPKRQLSENSASESPRPPPAVRRDSSGGASMGDDDDDADSDSANYGEDAFEELSVGGGRGQ